MRQGAAPALAYALALLAGPMAGWGMAGAADAAKPHAKPAHKLKPADDADAPDHALPADEEAEHVVKPGETLGGIAQRAKVPRVLIAEANSLTKPWAVHAGQHLMLPRTRHHVVKDGETGFDIAYHYDVPYPAIAVANGLKPGVKLKAGQRLLIPTIIDARPEPVASKGKREVKREVKHRAKPASDTAPDADLAAAEPETPDFIWPLTGKVVRRFAPRSAANYHDGLDIAGPTGAAVRATAGGTVIFAGAEPQSFGNLVVIDHGNGWQSAYGFLSKLTVAKGDTVKPHERIGLVGHTGKAPRSELHFELRKANKPVDPADQLSDAAKPDPKGD